MFHLTGVDKVIEQAGIKVVTDSGYKHFLCVSPDPEKGEEWNHKHKKLRYILEKLIGFSKMYAVASGRFRMESILFQQLEILTIWEMIQRYVQPLVLFD